MKTSVHLSFNGTCEEAFSTYARVLHGTVAYLLHYRDSPAAGQAPPDWQGKVYHATMHIGELTLMGGDPLFPDYHAAQGFSLVVNPDTREEAREAFEALANGGVVQMPLQQTHWSAAFGVVTDRFGIPWTINCEQPEEAA